MVKYMKEKNVKKDIINIIIIILVVVLIRMFIITPGIVNGSSMDNTLHDGELVIVNKIGLLFGINRYDIVVIKSDEGTLIKRVIGLPNETVKYADNILYINDKKQDTPIDFDETGDFTITANKNEYIVLGDNRSISKDSRVLGTFKKDEIKGKVNLVLFPFKDFGFVE